MKFFRSLMAAAVVAAPLTFAGEAAKATAGGVAFCPFGSQGFENGQCIPADVEETDLAGECFGNFIDQTPFSCVYSDNTPTSTGAENDCLEADGWWFPAENADGGVCRFGEGDDTPPVDTPPEEFEPQPTPEEDGPIANNNTNGNSNANSNASTAASTNTQRTSINNRYITAPQATVAPAAPATTSSQVGDVIVPLPNIGVSGFGTRDENTYGYNSNRNTFGTTVGVTVPFGSGQARRAADVEISRRDNDERFRLIQEATWMLKAGVLSKDVHPKHWEALYGTPVVVETYTAE